MKTVLFVDDDPDGPFFLRRALLRAKVECNVKPVRNAAAARSYLSGSDPFDSRDRFPFPAVVVLALPTEQRDNDSAAQLVTWIRLKSDCADLPIICFSSGEQAVRSDLEQLGVAFRRSTGDMAEVAQAVREAVSQFGQA